MNPPDVIASSAEAPSPRARDRIFASGEMADLTRAFDWSGTPVGPIEQWPEALLIAVNTMLASRHPMFIWWGPGLIQFYNDAYRPSIFADKHPKALGQPGRECWPEIWHIIGPQIEAVMSSGESTWHEDQLVPIYRDGKLEDVYWTYGYSPIRDAGGVIRGTLVVCTENTRRVLAEQMLSASTEWLEQSEARLRLINDALPAFVSYIDASLRYVSVNHVYEEWFGLPASEIVGLHVAELLGDAYGPLQPYLDAALAGQPQRFETRIHTLKGNRICSVVQIPDFDNNGRVRGIVIHSNDITERKQAEEALRRSVEQFRQIAEGLPQLVWVARPDGYHEWYNRRWYEYTGATCEASIGPGWNGLFHPDDRERAWNVWRHSLETGEPYRIEYRCRHRDGTYRWFLGSALPLRDIDGTILRWFGTCTDIDAQKRAEEALRASESRFRTLIEKANVGIVLGGFDGSLTYFNPLMLRTLGYTAEEIRLGNLRWSHITPHEFADRDARALEQLREYGICEPYEKQYFARDGRRVPFLLGASVIAGIDGAPDEVAVFLTDLTVLKRTEAALLQNEKLAAVGRLASSIAHEINNPLEAVVNLIYLSSLGPVSPTVAEYLATAQEELARVTSITTQTLRFHRQSTHAREISIRESLETVLTLFHNRLTNAGIIVDRQYRTDGRITAYEGDLRQVFANLIGNAFDATQRGGRIVLRLCDTLDPATGQPGVRLTIADNGCGMSPETLAHIFDAFFTTKNATGTGLGLWVSAEILRNHNARVRVRSRENVRSREAGAAHGTVFSVFLPAGGPAVGV